MRQKWQPDIEKRPHYRQTVEQPFAENLTYIFTKWGGFAAKCGVKERIAAPVTHDHPDEVPVAACWRHGWRVRDGG
jgi:hypothetical protein